MWVCRGLLDQAQLWNGLTSGDASDRCLTRQDIFSGEHFTGEKEKVMTETLQCAALMPPAELHVTQGGLIKLKISLPTTKPCVLYVLYYYS